MGQKISYFKKKGDPYVMLTGMGLVISLGMVFYIVSIILIKGLGFFWPSDIIHVELKDGKQYLGEVWGEQKKYISGTSGNDIIEIETQLKIGNRDLYGLDFTWVENKQINNRTYPPDATVFERREYGNFYGYIESIHYDPQKYKYDDLDEYQKAGRLHDLALEYQDQIREIEEDLNELITPLSQLQREISLLEISDRSKTERGAAQLKKLKEEALQIEEDIGSRYQQLSDQLQSSSLESQGLYLKVKTADDNIKEILQ